MPNKDKQAYEEGSSQSLTPEISIMIGSRPKAETVEPAVAVASKPQKRMSYQKIEFVKQAEELLSDMKKLVNIMGENTQIPEDWITQQRNDIKEELATIQQTKTGNVQRLTNLFNQAFANNQQPSAQQREINKELSALRDQNSVADLITTFNELQAAPSQPEFVPINIEQLIVRHITAVEPAITPSTSTSNENHSEEQQAKKRIPPEAQNPVDSGEKTEPEAEPMTIEVAPEDTIQNIETVAPTLATSNENHGSDTLEVEAPTQQAKKRTPSEARMPTSIEEETLAEAEPISIEAAQVDTVQNIEIVEPTLASSISTSEEISDIHQPEVEENQAAEIITHLDESHQTEELDVEAPTQQAKKRTPSEARMPTNIEEETLAEAEPMTIEVAQVDTVQNIEIVEPTLASSISTSEETITLDNESFTQTSSSSVPESSAMDNHSPHFVQPHISDYLYSLENSKISHADKRNAKLINENLQADLRAVEGWIRAYETIIEAYNNGSRGEISNVEHYKITLNNLKKEQEQLEGDLQISQTLLEKDPVKIRRNINADGTVNKEILEAESNYTYTSHGVTASHIEGSAIITAGQLKDLDDNARANAIADQLYQVSDNIDLTHTQITITAKNPMDLVGIANKIKATSDLSADDVVLFFKPRPNHILTQNEQEILDMFGIQKQDDGSYSEGTLKTYSTVVSSEKTYNCANLGENNEKYAALREKYRSIYEEAKGNLVGDKALARKEVRNAKLDNLYAADAIQDFENQRDHTGPARAA